MGRLAESIHIWPYCVLATYIWAILCTFDYTCMFSWATFGLYLLHGLLPSTFSSLSRADQYISSFRRWRLPNNRWLKALMLVYIYIIYGIFQTLLTIFISFSLRHLMNTGLPCHFNIKLLPCLLVERSNSNDVKENMSLVADILRICFTIRSQIKKHTQIFYHST